jgi:pyruvate/2-oxoglutarate dehydrogenase complex dihydrolipoamide dehydrogenase (E3) component
MQRVHEIRRRVYDEADEPSHFEKMGIVVLKGKATFTDDHNLRVVHEDGTATTFSAASIVIATGSSPRIPDIEGIGSVPFLTNESLFELERLPEKLLIIGAGPIGIEMGQAFQRLGSRVTVIDVASTMLPRDHQELTALLKESLEKEGIRFLLNHSITTLAMNGEFVTLSARENSSGALVVEEFDTILVSAGRKPSIEGLGLDAAGVGTSGEAITIDSSCRTSKRHIYACGDVCGRFQFTHMAEHMAKTAVSNMLLHLPSSMDERNIPWCTFSDPELAHTGFTEEDLKHENTSYEIYRFPYGKIDRAITESETTGWIRVYASGFDGKIFGADILGARAGELISEFALAIHSGVTLRQMSDTIHPYPTYALGNRRAADQWYVRKQSGPLVGILQFFFGYQGKTPASYGPDEIV